MKKVLAITSGLMAVNMLAAEGVFQRPEFNVDAKIEYNTKGITDGAVVSNHQFVPSVEVGVPVMDKANVYVGMDAYLRTRAEGNGNTVEPYIGVTYDITDIFTVDLGYRAKINATKAKSKRAVGVVATLNDGAQDDGTAENYHVTIDNDNPTIYNTKRVFNEFYVGLMADVLLNPSIYAKYDITQRKLNFEGAVRYTLDLGNFGVNGLAIDLGAKLGYCHNKKPLGISRSSKGWWNMYTHGNNQKYKDAVLTDMTSANLEDDAGGNQYIKQIVGTWGDFYGKKGFMYGEFNADLVYSLNDNAKVRAGVGFAFNNAKRAKNEAGNAYQFDIAGAVVNNNQHYINKENGKKRAVWFSTAAEFSF